MDRVALVNLTFCRLLLRRTFAEVRELCPRARSRDMSAIKVPSGDWYAEIPDRPWYDGRLSWTGRADNAFHAKAEAWMAWINRHNKLEGKK
jgi:hypothetical protein